MSDELPPPPPGIMGPKDSWLCAKCGNLVYVGLVHHCPTGPVVYLNDEQWEQFMYDMTHPKPPTTEMIEAARKMNEWTKGRKP